ncbi:hypothetical protein Q8F57_044865 [Paraburkholderia terrae]|uniref:hypothetical protein n=1 Tax=Paraburkholderia terrae TaxID=311230 RepID=UPI00296AB8D8|nr:hypothetical protein [Paraburkholderia terrae]MDW3663750.1 hypothetical protein [Paraburkholderia terrae]
MVHFGIGWLYGYPSYYLFGSGSSGLGLVQNDATGVHGENISMAARGSLACIDPQFTERAGAYGESPQQGVIGLTTSPTGTGVYGGGTTTAAGKQIGVRGECFDGVGIQGRSFGVGLAGQFIGNVHVQGHPGTSSGDLRVEGTSSLGGDVTADGNLDVKGTLNGAAINCDGNVGVKGNLNMSSANSDITLGDVAEGFTTHNDEIIEPGTVVVLDHDGSVRIASEAYDRKVAGVVSGAGNYRPAIVLDKQVSQANQLPVALVGKVCCKVDAQYSPIAIGDMLTTSPTSGHAMKATDPIKAFGAVIGKALRPLNANQGVIPILICLQ